MGRADGSEAGRTGDALSPAGRAARRPVRPPRPHTASAEELAAHAALLDTLKAPVWRVE